MVFIKGKNTLYKFKNYYISMLRKFDIRSLWYKNKIKIYDILVKRENLYSINQEGKFMSCKSYKLKKKKKKKKIV